MAESAQPPIQGKRLDAQVKNIDPAVAPLQTASTLPMTGDNKISTGLARPVKSNDPQSSVITQNPVADVQATLKPVELNKDIPGKLPEAPVYGIPVSSTPEPNKLQVTNSTQTPGKN